MRLVSGFRLAKYLAISVVSLIAVSCASNTAGLWERSGYQDIITHFLVSDNNQTLVFIGYDYHYVMEATPVLVSVLKWEHRKLLSASFDKDFALTADNEITGEYNIACDCKSASIPQRKWLLSKGFVYVSDESADDQLAAEFVYTGEIEGIRYATNDLNFSSYPSLNREYQLSIKIAHSVGEVIERVLLTPIAMFNDGVTIAAIGGMALLVGPLVLAEQAGGEP